MIDHISIEKWSKIDLQIFGGQYARIACNRSDLSGIPACIDSTYGLTYSRQPRSWKVDVEASDKLPNSRLVRVRCARHGA
eukprot:COSAG05_NODE_654_length_8069_cov_3.646926_1_plen_80_part_00